MEIKKQGRLLMQKLNSIAGHNAIPAVFIFFFSMAGCAGDEKMVFFNPDEVTRLLSGDTVKSWIRVSMTVDGEMADVSDCELRRMYTYGAIDDSLGYLVNSVPEFCESDSAVISSGEWSVLTLPTNNQIADRIRIIQGNDTLTKEILEITSRFMTLQSGPGEEVIVEGFEANQ